MLVFINSLELEQTDKEFILWLYQNYKNLMYLTAKMQISSPEVIKDILKYSFFKLIEKIGVLRSRDKHAWAGYVVATFRNTAFNYLKKQAYINGRLNDGNESDIDAGAT